MNLQAPARDQGKTRQKRQLESRTTAIPYLTQISSSKTLQVTAFKTLPSGNGLHIPENMNGSVLCN